jgi:Tfp pilus assembly protein PilZ
MDQEENRRFERVIAVTKIKLSGDPAWYECANSNISGTGLLFESARQLKVGESITLQIMLFAESGSVSNIHFFAEAKVIRIEPNSKKDIFEVAAEFIFDETVRKEVLRVIETIKSRNLKVDRPTSIEAILHKDKSG